ncbi:MAG: hypothetical protein NVS3B16_13290 [Vulcanimicrobiaceae bacterium]
MLPRPKERIGVAGLDLDAEYLRQALFGLLVVLAVAGIGVGIESLRLARLDSATVEQELRIATNAPRRAQVKSLALEVARYQSFAREAHAYRRSGTDVAVALARIGNSIPERVWLDSLDRQTDGYTVAGGAASVDTLGGTIVALGRALPDTHAMLVNIDNRASQGNGVRFSARIAGTPNTAIDAARRASTPANTAFPYAGATP